MAGYTRQSTATIINGAGITAPPLNAEFNQIVSAFNSSSGHTHTGGTGDGPQIPLATSITGYLPLANGGVGGKNNVTNAIPTANDDSGDGYAPGSLWENSSTGRIYVCVGNNSGAAVWRELVQQNLAGAMITDVDINGGDIDGTDIGSASVGTGSFSTINASGNITGNLVGNSAGVHNGAVTGNVTGNITSSGTSAFGAIDVNGGNIDGTIIGANVLAAISGSTITGNSFVGPLTGTVAGNVTGNLAGNVTASSGTTILNNLTINGTIDVTSTKIENVVDPTSAQQAATKNYVDTQVSNLVASAPAALDTLNELAAAIGDDANFSTTITNSIAAKLPLAGGTLTGNINAGGNTVTNLAAPSANSDAATKAYVDTGVGSNAAAANSATAAGNSATSASNSATAAASSLDTFQDTYLGAASSDPSTDLDGNALATGALYFNSTTNVTRVYTGSTWQTASASIEGIKADFVYVATSGQTVFSGNDSSSNTMAIDTAGLVNVFLNGIRLITTTDYAVSAANNRVTLNAGATVGDLLEVEVFGNFAGQSGSSVAITGGTINNTTFNNVTYSGNISTTGTVDGRDVSVDGTKLDGIEAGAKADQTAAEVRALVESASDSNVFTDADHTKLNAIEASATADQTDAEIRTAVGNASDSNIFTDADHSKLDGIAASANNYVHPTGAGNNHIPTGGATDQVLKYVSSGTAQWADAGGAFAASTVTITANTTLTTAQNGNLIRVTAAGPKVIFLPATANGLYYVFSNETAYDMYIKPYGTNSINGVANQSIKLAAGADGIMACGTAGTNWSTTGITRSMVIAKVTTLHNEVYNYADGARLTGTYNTLGTTMLVCVGSGTAGSNTSAFGSYNYRSGGGGGQSYAEKFISSPASSYAYDIPAGPNRNGHSASYDKTTTAAGMTCTPGPDSPGPTHHNNNIPGRAGGTASGGTVNFTGGSGASATTTKVGGGGGAATRAGNGGNAQPSYGGGTGGNNASSSAFGAAATARNNSTHSITNSTSETYLAGTQDTTNDNYTGSGAGPKTVVNFGSLSFTIADHSHLERGGPVGGGAGGYTRYGYGGYVTFVEFI